MEALYKQLMIMKDRPGMYLGRKSLSLLGAYITGYLDHQYEIERDFASTFTAFNDFVHEYYCISTCQDWVKIITFNSSTDEDAVDRFYMLLDLFLERQTGIDADIKQLCK